MIVVYGFLSDFLILKLPITPLEIASVVFILAVTLGVASYKMRVVN
jgi:hypothetical protein